MKKLCIWMRQSSKRLLSFTLAVCLISSIAPIQNFKAAATGEVASEALFLLSVSSTDISLAAASQDTLVASASVVTKDEKTYLSVTGIKEGTARIDVNTVVNGQIAATLSIPVTVTAVSGVLKPEIIGSIETGKIGTAVLPFTADSNFININDVSVTAITQDTSIASATAVTNSEKTETNLSISGIKTGSTSMDVKFTVNGITETLTVPLTITAAIAAFEIDFT